MKETSETRNFFFIAFDGSLIREDQKIRKTRENVILGFLFPQVSLS